MNKYGSWPLVALIVVQLALLAVLVALVLHLFGLI
jgi:hypothetical protein